MNSSDTLPKPPTPSAIRKVDFQTDEGAARGAGPNSMWIGGSWGTGRVRHHLLMRASLPAPKRKRCTSPEPADPDIASTALPLSDQWITPSLLAYTREVWTEHYEREVSEVEAIEILRNVRAYAEVMLEAKALTEAAP